MPAGLHARARTRGPEGEAMTDDRQPGAPAPAEPPVADADPVRLLEREWESLVQTPVAARFRDWRRDEPALRRFESAEAALAFLADSRRRKGEDELLLALLRIARDDRLAGR